MDLTAAVSADLVLLGQALDDPRIDDPRLDDPRIDDPGIDVAGIDLAGTLFGLIAAVRAAVDSYEGLTITMTDAATPLTITTLTDGTGVTADPHLVAASVQIPITSRTEGRGVPVAIVTLYASQPGAFVDLVADLAWLTGLGADAFVLDAHLVPPTGAAEPGAVSAVQVMSIVNQALGVLIGQGHAPAQAAAELDSRAGAAGTGRYLAAVRVLSALHTDPS